MNNIFFFFYLNQILTIQIRVLFFLIQKNLDYTPCNYVFKNIYSETHVSMKLNDNLVLRPE